MTDAALPGAAFVSARRLLKHLRDVMAGSGNAPTRLHKIVALIAAELHADVCSCYVMRAGEVLELFATFGLRQEAVRVTRLQVGEGIIGAIAAQAQPLALANARAHPNFAYRPETGEDPFQSMMGVPILRGGRVRGVLAIQHKERQQYGEDTIELLETIGMVVAEMIAQGELISGSEISLAGDPSLGPRQIEGLTLNGGMASGHAVLHRPQITVREMIAENAADERIRLHSALKSMLSEIDAFLAAPTGDAPTDTYDILDAYRILAADHGWIAKLEDAIAQGLTAEAAVQKTRNDYRARFGQISDPMIREKLADFDDMVDRLLRHLTGRAATAAATLPDDAILIARSLGPAELLDYDRKKLRGLILETGTNASHVAIIAKAFDIPVIGQCTGILTRLEPLDPVIIDGARGTVYIRPGEDVQEHFNRHQILQHQRHQELDKLRHVPAVTADGVAVDLLLNCGLDIDFEHLATTNAAGVGLYRTEIPFLVREDYPDVAQQTALYRRAFAAVGDRSFTVRTLDVGGDKMLPSLARRDEENPALGWRAIRIGLDRPAILRQQLRALLAAADGRAFNLMFPMIASVAEMLEAKEILALECAVRTEAGLRNPARLSVGTIVEVPSLLWQLPALLPHVDFLCVGSNDLLQYMFAADRGNAVINARYDCLSPAFLLMLRELVVCCRVADKSVSICGEMAGRPLEAMALLGLGVTALSFSPASFIQIKKMVRSLHVRKLQEYVSSQLLRPESSLRNKLQAFALDHGVVLD
ncbi:MAG: phosphoenolpyruvate--protein phosphotransferase [Alphaproteobacteria bacterium]